LCSVPIKQSCIRTTVNQGTVGNYLLAELTISESGMQKH
jgi:hypothetical protein